MLTAVKSKLKKHTRLFRLAGRQRKDKTGASTSSLQTDILIVQSANSAAYRSTNPFEWPDEQDEHDTVDDDRALHLAAKQRLLARLHPYCHSTDPLAPHRTAPPTLSEYTISILTRSAEVNNSQKRRVVRAHLHRESEPTALLTRRFWSQNDVGTATRSSLGGSTRTVYRRIGGGFQSLVARGKLRTKGLSASETNLSSPHRATGATGDYCPTGMAYNGVTVRRPPPEDGLLGRWRAWTRQHLRRNRRVAVADDDGAAGVP